MRILQMGRAKMLIGGKKGTDYAAVALLLVHFILTVGSIATISEKKMITILQTPKLMTRKK